MAGEAVGPARFGGLTMGQWLIAGAVGVVALAAWQPGSDPAPAADPPLAPAQVAKCRELLADGAKIALIRARPAPNRLDVEDSLWAQMPAQAKDATLAAVACDAWGTRGPQGGQYVVAYGYRSGKRLEMLTASGAVRD